MGRHPEIFKATQVAIIRAGEKGGFLEDAVARLGQFVQGQAELRGKLVGSLIYPIVLVSLGAVILVVIFTVLIPMVRPMFDRIEQLPGITEAVFGIASFSAGYVRDLFELGSLSVGLGGVGTMSLISERLKPVYGSQNPRGGVVFLRVRPVAVPVMDHSMMGMD